MNRRDFFSVFAALPVVGLAAVAKAVKPDNEPDHVLDGKVLVRGTLVVEGVQTGIALHAGDGKPKSPYVAIYCVGTKK